MSTPDTSTTDTAEAEPPEVRGDLLLVDDDALHALRMARGLEARGFQVTCAGSLAEASTLIEAHAPGFAVLEMRLVDGTGLSLIEDLLGRRPDARAVVLTAFGAIASASHSTANVALAFGSVWFSSSMNESCAALPMDWK